VKKSERLARENAELRKRIELLEATVQRLVTAPAYVPYPVPTVQPWLPLGPIWQIDPTPQYTTCGTTVVAGPIGPAPGTALPYATICSGISNGPITASDFVAYNTTDCASQS
jgi:hypothetical protein